MVHFLFDVSASNMQSYQLKELMKQHSEKSICSNHSYTPHVVAIHNPKNRFAVKLKETVTTALKLTRNLTNIDLLNKAFSSQHFHSCAMMGFGTWESRAYYMIFFLLFL